MTVKYGWEFRYFAALIRFVQLTRLDSLIPAGRVRGAAGGPAVIRISLSGANGPPAASEPSTLPERAEALSDFDIYDPRTARMLN